MMEAAQKPDRMLTAEEMAAVLSVNVLTVLRMAGRGDIPSYKIGRQYRFDADEVLASLKREQGPSIRADNGQG
jgi:excisionase family DNA binding protein